MLQNIWKKVWFNPSIPADLSGCIKMTAVLTSSYDTSAVNATFSSALSWLTFSHYEIFSYTIEAQNNCEKYSVMITCPPSSISCHIPLSFFNFLIWFFFFLSRHTYERYVYFDHPHGAKIAYCNPTTSSTPVKHHCNPEHPVYLSATWIYAVCPYTFFFFFLKKSWFTPLLIPQVLNNNIEFYP